MDSTPVSGDTSPFTKKNRANSILGHFGQSAISSLVFDQSKIFTFKDNTDILIFSKMNTIEKAAVYYNPNFLD